MYNLRKTRELAQRIVHLISEKERAGLDEALYLLKSHYADQPHLVTKAYEIACLVVVKQLIEKKQPDEASMLSPKADWMAIRAAQAIWEGNLGQAFSLLRIANIGGARPALCRRVVFDLLRGLENSERVTELCYTPKAIISIEIGRIAGHGMVLLKNSPSPRHVLGWHRDTPDLPRPSTVDHSALFMRNLTEFNSDAPLGRINWSKYIDELSAGFALVTEDIA